MDRDGMAALDKFDGMFVKQTRKGCIQELCGCEAKNEFKIFPDGDAAKDDANMTMYSLEESSCLVRLCCQGNRSFTQTMWLGNKDNQGAVALQMKRPLACPLQPCCCCN